MLLRIGSGQAYFSGFYSPLYFVILFLKLGSTGDTIPHHFIIEQALDFYFSSPLVRLGRSNRRGFHVVVTKKLLAGIDARSVYQSIHGESACIIHKYFSQAQNRIKRKNDLSVRLTRTAENPHAEGEGLLQTDQAVHDPRKGNRIRRGGNQDRQ
jgi:hypothetical protein